MSRALVNREPYGLFKVVADAHTDEVLGVDVVAENTADVIYAGVLAVRFHPTVRDLTDTFAPLAVPEYPRPMSQSA